MAADPELLAAFDKACDYFNKHDFTSQSWAQTMDGLLDDNVAMKRLDDPGYHQGKAVVRNYFLNGNGYGDQAKVTYTSKVCLTVGKRGFISGFADFVDQDGTNHPPSPPRRIAYSYTYSKENGSWKAIHLWGAYVAPK
jgi:hypothetical protein